VVEGQARVPLRHAPAARATSPSKLGEDFEGGPPRAAAAGGRVVRRHPQAYDADDRVPAPGRKPHPPGHRAEIAKRECGWSPAQDARVRHRAG